MLRFATVYAHKLIAFDSLPLLLGHYKSGDTPLFMTSQISQYVFLGCEKCEDTFFRTEEMEE